MNRAKTRHEWELNDIMNKFYEIKLKKNADRGFLKWLNKKVQ
jgi:hypothetical protein